MGVFIRSAIVAMLEGTRGAAAGSPLLRDDAAYGGSVPRDLAARHDEYLYGGLK